ncbi:gamma-soluble NSF attachment protein-like [Ylistrum balloti]|uniref:gamma-soluble NSF attachment protein-like n=1 Tax=Ylistrum balloti TaxID=509963 RepID=UPI002905CB24|nr:gamma-soluble NSF attachment protein-like [Ylistrum balloti]
MASDMKQRKAAEAMDHIRQAEKCMKTSLFKWRPDLDGAASEYNKAATCYRNAKCLKEAKDACIKAAEVQLQMNAPFHAAKSYEQAGLICKENNMIEDSINLMEYAAKLFQEDGSPDTAALVLDRAAKIVEISHPTKSVQLFQKACDVSELEDKPRQCAEFIGKAARLLIHLQKYDEALTALKREIDFLASVENFPAISRVLIGAILVYLKQGDPVGAEQFYNSALGYPGFGDSEEAALIDELIQTYSDGDEEGCRAALSSPTIKFMDNAFAKLARDMEIPAGMGRRVPRHQEAVSGSVAPGQTSRAQLDEDDLEEGGLC